MPALNRSAFIHIPRTISDGVYTGICRSSQSHIHIDIYSAIYIRSGSWIMLIRPESRPPRPIKVCREQSADEVYTCGILIQCSGPSVSRNKGLCRGILDKPAGSAGCSRRARKPDTEGLRTSADGLADRIGPGEPGNSCGKLSQTLLNAPGYGWSGRRPKSRPNSTFSWARRRKVTPGPWVTFGMASRPKVL